MLLNFGTDTPDVEMLLCQSMGLTLPSDKEKYIGAFLNLRLVNFEQDE